MNDSSAPEMSRNDEIAKLAELIADIQVCMFTTTDKTSHLKSRPMAVQEVEFDGDLWFFTKLSGRKIDQIRQTPQVNVVLSSNRSWVSVSGEAEIVHDEVKAKQLWNTRISAWFPDGPEDPELVMIKVHADGAEYWDTPGAAVVSMLSFVKARVTGKPYHIEDERVDL
jgi:general stress protein 26